jgi:hypothetical protein
MSTAYMIKSTRTYSLYLLYKAANFLNMSQFGI